MTNLTIKPQKRHSIIKYSLLRFLFLLSVFTAFSFETFGGCSIKLLTRQNDCVPATSQFQRSDNSGQSVVNVAWDFGDGNTSADNSQIVSHLYNVAGSFKAKVVVTYSDGTTCTATADKVTVFPVPKAAYSYASLPPFGMSQCFKHDGGYNKFCFNDKSVPGAAGAPIINWVWNTGDGDTTVKQNICHIYQAPGNYRVSLRVTDSNGCTNIVFLPSVVVFKDIKPSFSQAAEHHCNGDKITFTNKTDTAGYGADRFVWNFGDGSVDSAHYNIAHTFKPGTYKVRLTMFNLAGCSGTDSAVITVYPFKPIITIKNPSCYNDNAANGVTFSALQQPLASVWTWTFGDPNGAENTISNRWTVNHHYSAPGVYIMRLVIKSDDATCGKNGEADTCVTIKIKGVKAMINLPDSFPVNNYYPARKMSKTAFSNAACGKTISYATFAANPNTARHVKYKYCSAKVLRSSYDSVIDCYGKLQGSRLRSVTLQPTDSVVSFYKDSIETVHTWNPGDAVPAGNIYYPSSGKLVFNNMHDSNMRTCKLPNLVRFANNSMKYSGYNAVDDNTLLNAADPAHAWGDTCRWHSYPMASGSLTYLWKFNDPSGSNCTSTVSNQNWDCNFSTLAAPYHYYKGTKGYPKGGCQEADLQVSDPVTGCSDSTAVYLKQGPPQAYWDRSQFCKMNWDIQRSLSGASEAGTGFRLGSSGDVCGISGSSLMINFSQTTPSCGAPHWWITFDSAHTTHYRKCSAKDSSIDYGFTGDPGLDYAKGKNGYPAAGPADYWMSAPWNGAYSYQAGDEGCKTIGLVLQNGDCFDTAWYHDYICVKSLSADFDLYQEWPAHTTLIDSTVNSSHGHVSAYNGGTGVEVLIKPHDTKAEVSSYVWQAERKQIPAGSDYYKLPVWPDSATLFPFTSYSDSFGTPAGKYYFLNDASNLYVLVSQGSNSVKKAIHSFPLSASEIDSLRNKKHVNIAASDTRARALPMACGAKAATLYADALYVNGNRNELQLSSNTDSVYLPYPGFYDFTSAVQNLQGCITTKTYHLIYGHFAEFYTRHDSVVCLGSPVDFTYRVRYWSTNCPADPVTGIKPEGCLGGADEGMPDSVDFAPWNHANPTAYRDSLVSKWSVTKKPANYQPETIYWNFGDNTVFNKVPNGAAIRHTYTKPGVYTVTMRTIDWRGEVVNTVRRNLVKVVQLSGDFALRNLKDTLAYCPPKTIDLKATVHILGNIYTDNVISGGGAIVPKTFVADTVSSYTWLPGDSSKINSGSDSTVQTTYYGDGVYTYGLKITTAAGCTYQVSKPHFITIKGNAAGDAHWTASRNNSKLEMQFTNDSTHLSNYFWQFGDGNAATVPDPKHAYASAGQYLVKLKTTNSLSCTDVYDSMVVISTAPGVAESDKLLPGLALYPNPFYKAIMITYNLPAKEHIKIELMDITGKILAIVTDEVQGPGSHNTEIKAADMKMQPGVYMLRFSMQSGQVSRQIIYAR